MLHSVLCPEMNFGEIKSIQPFVMFEVHARDLDLPQVDLMNFRVEYVRPRSG